MWIGRHEDLSLVDCTGVHLTELPVQQPLLRGLLLRAQQSAEEDQADHHRQRPQLDQK